MTDEDPNAGGKRKYQSRDLGGTRGENDHRNQPYSPTEGDRDYSANLRTPLFGSAMSVSHITRK